MTRLPGDTRPGRGAEIRASLGHPVIDGDGHTIEHLPLLMDYVKEVAGPDLTRRILKTIQESREFRWGSLDEAARREWRVGRPAFWVVPTRNTLDRATGMLPALLRARLEEFGVDFGILHPTVPLYLLGQDDAEARRALSRATNRMNADLFRPHRDRLTPAALIPAHTPEEAIEELDYAIGTLGLKVACIASYVRRPVEGVAKRAPELAEHAYWIDPLALDSQYDYDPVWRRFQELGVAVSSHSVSIGWGARNSISNFNFNHIGSFRTSAEVFAKAIFLGGVTRRFPNLKFAFLEGGAGWARTLYGDIIGHWQKRNLAALEAVRPANLDTDKLADLFRQYGGGVFESRTGEVTGTKVTEFEWRVRDVPPTPEAIDDWAACGITRAEDIRDLYVPNFYFGCEADDPLNAGAFDTRANPFGARLKAFFGSDISHWDVPDMSLVLEEAYELIEHGMVDDADFRAFTFANAAELHAGMNPKFFQGTPVEDAVAKLMGERKAAAE